MVPPYVDISQFTYSFNPLINILTSHIIYHSDVDLSQFTYLVTPLINILTSKYFVCLFCNLPNHCIRVVLKENNDPCCCLNGNPIFYQIAGISVSLFQLLSGEYYTLVMVDPDDPNAKEGTNQ